MLRVAGILNQQRAGELGTLTAMDTFFLLTTSGYGAFAVKGFAVCLNTAAAAVAFPVSTARAMQSAT